MDEVKLQKIQQYLQALRALQRSVERAVQMDVYQGTGRMAVKQYTGIQRKVAELFPEDFYVTDTLTLELDDQIEERHLLSQVQLAAGQMVIYLEGVLRENHRHPGEGGFRPGEFPLERGDWRAIGREIQDQVMRLTRETIQRAVSNIDVDVQPGRGESYRDANLEGAQLNGANFSGRNLRGANLAKVSAVDSNFSGANLKDASLEEGNFENANFSGANLKNANAEHARFVGANLTGTNFRDANLEGVDFTEAKLAGANLYGANLEGATLPNGEAFERESDLNRYHAAHGHESGRRIRIEIDTDDDEKPKREPPEPPTPMPPMPPVPPTPPERF
jgi:hypothetical protein